MGRAVSHGDRADRAVSPGLGQVASVSGGETTMAAEKERSWWSDSLK